MIPSKKRKVFVFLSLATSMLVTGLAQANELGKLNIRISATIVRGTCQVSASSNDIDFGNLQSRAFQAKGIKAEGVNPITRDINVNCSNVDAKANLKLSLQADTVIDDILVSNNTDVGFVVDDANGMRITPNLSTSKIPFKLNSGRATVPLVVTPVSVTGNEPREGSVSAQLYVLVNFD